MDLNEIFRNHKPRVQTSYETAFLFYKYCDWLKIYLAIFATKLLFIHNKKIGAKIYYHKRHDDAWSGIIIVIIIHRAIQYVGYLPRVHTHYRDYVSRAALTFAYKTTTLVKYTKWVLLTARLNKRLVSDGRVQSAAIIISTSTLACGEIWPIYNVSWSQRLASKSRWKNIG